MLTWLGVIAALFSVARFLDENYSSDAVRHEVRGAVRAIRKVAEDVMPDVNEGEEASAWRFLGYAVFLGALVYFFNSTFVKVRSLLVEFRPTGADHYAAMVDSITVWDWLITIIFILFLLTTAMDVGRSLVLHILEKSADPKRSPFTYGAALVSVLLTVLKFI